MVPKPLFPGYTIPFQEIAQYLIGVRDHGSELEAIEGFA
jgi:hypothetical protein